MTTRRRRHEAPDGYRYVSATSDEIAEYLAKHNGHYPPRSVPRVQCVHCERRLWGAGLVIGRHPETCPVLVARRQADLDAIHAQQTNRSES